MVVETLACRYHEYYYFSFSYFKTCGYLKKAL
ncbi:hypothetical protein T11_14876 [Trichinella zimbabwensis]|uniref:Uncharacterized protein n=1 Tax=Trichinella zimbabwensis TaxID=268475 RepID=A0A0V1DLH7_9BILA|nr:hypothetical protein T11_14876 [Trichinella zimbabwensis]